MVLSGSKGSASSSTNNDTLRTRWNSKYYTLVITIGTAQKINYKKFLYSFFCCCFLFFLFSFFKFVKTSHLDCLCSLISKDFFWTIIALRIKITLPRPKWRAMRLKMKVLRDRILTKSFAFSTTIVGNCLIMWNSRKQEKQTLTINIGLQSFFFCFQRMMNDLRSVLSKLKNQKLKQFQPQMKKGVSWPCNIKITQLTNLQITNSY